MAFSPGGGEEGGMGKNFDRGTRVIFCEFEIWEIVIFSGCSKWWLFLGDWKNKHFLGAMHYFAYLSEFMKSTPRVFARTCKNVS